MDKNFKKINAAGHGFYCCSAASKFGRRRQPLHAHHLAHGLVAVAPLNDLLKHVLGDGQASKLAPHQCLEVVGLAQHQIRPFVVGIFVHQPTVVAEGVGGHATELIKIQMTDVAQIVADGLETDFDGYDVWLGMIKAEVPSGGK